MITLTKGSLSITLRNPDFGNTESIECRRIQRKNRSGELIMYRDPQWPKTNILVLEFSYLKPDDLSKLIYFIKQTLGQIVRLTYTDGRQWDGVLLSPTDELSEKGTDNFTAKIQFQGELV